MANFLKLQVKDASHDWQYINMDLVQEIVPTCRKDYGCRLIFSCVDENDFMYSDVIETPKEILERLRCGDCDEIDALAEPVNPLFEAMGMESVDTGNLTIGGRDE